MRVSPSTKLNLSLQLEYEKMDKLRTEGKKFAEQGCRKMRKGQVPFSPQLKATSAKVDLYKLTIRWKKGGRVSSRKMERLSKSCKVNGHKTLPLDALETRLTSARRMYNITKRKAPEIRSQFLQELAEARAAKNNTKAASEIKSMRVQEEIRASFRRINYMRGKKNATGVSLISFTDSEGETRETQQREVVETLSLIHI